jgi:hypothetical protein
MLEPQLQPYTSNFSHNAYPEFTDNNYEYRDHITVTSTSKT